MPPAARITDNVAHPLPPVLSPGPGSTNVLIGFLPAWRGIPTAAAAGLQAAKQASEIVIKAAQAVTAAATGPALPAAKAAEEATKTAQSVAMTSAISAVSAGADKHACVTPFPIPPHGPGVVIDGSPTVLINDLPACRMGDTILEPIGPPNKIVKGCPTVLIGISGHGRPVQVVAKTDVRPPPFDVSKSPGDRRIVDSWSKSFPNLGSDYEVLGSATPDYNCIAHTLGENDQWVNPITSNDADPLTGMDELYKEQGYQRESGLDFTSEPGKQKVVVYATKNPDGSIKEVTHGAIQRPDGVWTSKLGQGPLIAHRTPNSLNGNSYGEPVAVYSK